MEIYTDRFRDIEPNSKPGKFIIVCGLSGSGKSTLVGEALQRLQNLNYLKTFTTRPFRNENEKNTSYEYIFVSAEKYEEMKNNSGNWDHSVIYGESYGADMELAKNNLKAGTNLIVNSIPTLQAIEDLKKVYDEHAIVVLIDARKDDTHLRLFSERPLHESGRTTIEAEMDVLQVKMQADYVFTPVKILEKDKKDFCKLMSEILLR